MQLFVALDHFSKARIVTFVEFSYSLRRRRVAERAETRGIHVRILVARKKNVVGVNEEKKRRGEKKMISILPFAILVPWCPFLVYGLHRMKRHVELE